MAAASDSGSIRGISAWLTYPLVMVSALALYYRLIVNGADPAVASTILALGGLLVVVWLEFRLPYRADWKPDRADTVGDAAFLLFVQALLPRLLGLAAVYLLAGLLDGGKASSIWPHHWPLATQCLLMLLLADLMRYFLHLACHRAPLLWRLHSIHHQPDKLYSLNVGRFHPLEKSLQFVFDSLPFLALGVSLEVVGGYFVFYAVNGFFQHSNIDLRCGFLSYLISTAELHRWHHARDRAQVSCNYGNNLAIWDLVFGSFYRPNDREVESVGVDGYPARGFLASLWQPFNGGSARQALDRMKRIGGRPLIRAAALVYCAPLWLACLRPASIQARLLKQILARQSGTAFGRQHGFAAIGNHLDFQRKVAVQNYETLRPWIEKQARHGSAETTCDPIVVHAQTSGSTGKAKYIPITDRSLSAMRRGQVLNALMLRDAFPEAFDGKILGITSPALEGINDWGVAVGSTSGLLRQNLPSRARKNLLLPESVFAIEDQNLKYDLIAVTALAEADIRFIATANPSTLLQLLNRIAENWPRYRPVLCGTRIPAAGFASQANALPAGLRVEADARRLAQLDSVFAACDRPGLGDLWPGLRLVVTWTGGSCGVPLGAVRRSLPRGCHVVELGYLASELRGTYTYPRLGLGIPALLENYYEFVEVDDWESGRQEFRQLHELRQGERYYLFITNWNGLYRYDINDIVEVRGRYLNTPCLEFVQKGKGTTSITGEKLTESQLVEMLAGLRVSERIETAFYLAIADETDSRYRLHVEFDDDRRDFAGLETRIDGLLQEINCEYRAKRQSGRLKSLQLVPLKPGAGEAYKSFQVRRGQRESQFKVMTLQYARDVKFPIAAYRIDEEAAA